MFQPVINGANQIEMHDHRNWAWVLCAYLEIGPGIASVFPWPGWTEYFFGAGFSKYFGKTLACTCSSSREDLSLGWK
jgi:hypothetical protein